MLVFDDTAATPVDKPFDAVFPMDVAQVRVVIYDEVVKNLILYLKKYVIQYNLAGITEIFSLNISRLGSGTSACPWKNAEYPHIIRTMILNKRACLPVGNRFYCIQHSNHIKTLAHLHCKSEKQKQKEKVPVSPRLHHKRALLYNSIDQESHDRHCYPTT